MTVPDVKTVHRTVLSHAWQQSPEVPKRHFRDCKRSPRSRASPDFGSSPIQKTPFTSVKGEFSAVPPYFIYAVTHIYLTFYNGNYSGITYFNRSIIRFRSYLHHPFPKLPFSRIFFIFCSISCKASLNSPGSSLWRLE